MKTTAYLLILTTLLSTVDSWQTSKFTRREAFQTVFTIGSFTFLPNEARATYSAYTAREKDWESRQKTGEVSYSSARDLKRQLREIAPMNAKGEIFCPNGPSSNVSPMMENKCGDRLAMPSVYGRQDDIVGNSIPGFSSDYQFGGSSGALAGNNGVEFLDYGKTAGATGRWNDVNWTRFDVCLTWG